MKKENFLELLNLYLDNELSSEQTDDLIAAVNRNEEYHSLYIEYLRIHKACLSMGSCVSSETRTRSSVKQTVYALGGLAAAIALIGMAGQNLLPLFQTGQSETHAEAVSAMQERDDFVHVLEATRIVTPSDSFFASASDQRLAGNAPELAFPIPNRQSWKNEIPVQGLGVPYSFGSDRRIVFENAARILEGLRYESLNRFIDSQNERFRSLNLSVSESLSENGSGFILTKADPTFSQR